MLYGTLLLTGTSLVAQVLGFIYRIFLSRLVGAEIMGLYQLILPVYSVVLSITAVGLTVAVSNLSAEYAARGNEGAMGAVLWRCLAAFLILFALVAGVTVLFLIVLGHFFGQDQMLLISLGAIVLCLLVLRDRLDEKEEETC